MPINYTKYPPDWEERRKRILKRANNCCEKCGVANGILVYSVKLYGGGHEWFMWRNQAEAMARCLWKIENVGEPIVRLVKVVLTIAHLDHDEENWNVEDERLEAMCQLCHLQYDIKEKLRRIKVKTQ